RHPVSRPVSRAREAATARHTGVAWRFGRDAERQRRKDQPAAVHLARLRGDRTPSMTLLAAAARVLLSAFLAWYVGHAINAPDMARVAAIAAAAVAVLTFWRPGLGLLLLTGLAPAGALFAPAPVRTAELLAWSFLSAWLLRIWAPLSANGWPRALTVPALLYLAVVVTSWLAITIGGAAGIQPSAWPQFLFQSIAADHLARSSPEPETWTLLQSATGIAVFLATVGLTRNDRRLAPELARTLVL